MLRALALLVLLLAPARATAQIVGVASDDTSGVLARRLSAELRARGYDTRDLTRETAETPTDVLAALAWAHDDPASVRVCVTAAPGRAPGCETLEDPDAAVLLLRAVELVRAHLGDPVAHATSDPTPTPAISPAPAPAPARTDTWSATLAFAMGPPIDALSTTLGIGAAVTWSPDPWLALELGGFTSLLDARVVDTAGTASFAARLLSLGLDFRIPPEVLSGHRLLLGAGAALAGAEVHARASAPLEARDDAFVAALLYARLALVVHLTGPLGLSIGARAGGASPRPSFVFDAREVARWGAPFVLVELGLTVDLGT